MSTKVLFAPLAQLQLPSHCGPCSLSACLFILGINASQRALATAAGRRVSVFTHGIDEKGLRRAARVFGVRSEFLLCDRQGDGPQFARQLRAHLSQGNPAVLLIRDFDHWVAVLGFLKSRRQFIIVDTRDENSLFRRWTGARLLREAWNRNPPDGDHDEPDQYFAILLSREDGQPARWRVSEEWLRLCERGSGDTAAGMARDLGEIARLASPGNKEIADGPTLAELLDEYEEPILDSITRWGEGNVRLNKTDLRNFYRDYKIIASSTGIRVAADSDRSVIVGQLTSLLTSYWWGARF